MELRQLRYFLALAGTLNFTRAAAELFVAQSALSQQIARLETELDVRLVERTSRRVRLTKAGQLLAQRAETLVRMSQDIEAEIADVAGAVRGSLHLGLTQGMDGIVDLAGLLAQFHERHPDVALSVREGRTARVAEEVADERLELGVVGTEIARLRTGLTGIELGWERLVVVVAPTHPLAGERQVALADLAATGPVIDPADHTRLFELVDAAWARTGVHRVAIMQVLELGQMARYAARGIGAALVPAAALRGISPPTGQPDFCTISLTEDIEYPVTLIFRSPTPSSPAARELLTLLAENIGPDSDVGRAIQACTRPPPLRRMTGTG